MHLTFAPKNVLQMDDVKLIMAFRNFRGEGGMYNREGDRNFTIRIEDPADYDALRERGWNVSSKPPRDEDEEPMMKMKVKLTFKGRGPDVFLHVGNTTRRLTEETIDCLDFIDIERVDMDVRAFDWSDHGRSGRTAYLNKMHVVQKLDRFAERYGAIGDDETMPF